MPEPVSHPVTRASDLSNNDLVERMAAWGVVVERVDAGQPIPGSFWGEPEAGIIGNRVYCRDDTPVHSMLHTACHYLCMDEGRRARLHTDCGGTDLEESAVCYLQCLLADEVPGYSREQMWADMDAWGYSFRLGSARAWFEADADDAQAWLRQRGLLSLLSAPR